MGYYFNTKSKSTKKEEILITKKSVLDKEISNSKEIEGIFDDEEIIHNKKAIDTEKLNILKEKISDKEILVNKETAIKNAIFLKLGCNKITKINKDKIETDKVSKNIMLSAWNINCGITAGKPVPPPIVYKNNNPTSKVTFMSTWGIKCGIATYTSHLLNNINKYYGKDIIEIFPMNNKEDMYEIESNLIHLQHEFGIMPQKISSDTKVIITFHAVFKTPKALLKQFESDLNVAAYIVHSKIAGKVLRMNTKKAVYVIPHGSEIIKLPYESKSAIKKELNFDKLGIKDTDKCAFLFGFQSDNKNFGRVIEACKNTGVKLIISGSKSDHDFEAPEIVIPKFDKRNVVFLNKFLDDNEINMYASACDLLIFDYVPQKHYSCSGAMHRTIGSGNPVICSRVNHFSDIFEDDQCLKFKDQEELELKILKGLELWDEYSKKSLSYADLTSWENVSKMHLNVYNNYVDVIDIQNEDYKDKIVFVSSWNVKCGIALYTEDLLNSIKELNSEKSDNFKVIPIKSSYKLNAKLLHFQHEFGLMPFPQKVLGKVIMTWHSVGKINNRSMEESIHKFEKVNDIVAHIVTCEGALSQMKTSKDVYVVGLGTKLMKPITKEEARKILNIDNIKKPIGFIFGFQSANKNYDRLINAAKKTDIHLIICSSMHSCGYKVNIDDNNNITFVDKYLTDDEIDLYASASNILLFDYTSQNHYSSSSALHRTVGAGRPVVCHDTNHFNDIRHELDGALKFKNDKELENFIIEALKREKELGDKALDYAKRTSREEVAKKHIEIYSKYVDV